MENYCKNNPDVLVVDLRFGDGQEPSLANKGSVAYYSMDSSVCVPFDMQTKTAPLDTIAKLFAASGKSHFVLNCASGRRAQLIADQLTEKNDIPQDKMFVCGVNGLQSAFGEAKVSPHNFFRDEEGTPIFAQIFDDKGTSTLTYILGDPKTRDAIIIDPVIEHVDRDIETLKRMNLNLKYALNTHCHADHITGSGELKKKLGQSVKSVISSASMADADIKLGPLEEIQFGERKLVALATPGHTNGCMSFYVPDMAAVFTGDALLIQGCGRTDFQEGSSEKLYDSVHSSIFSLPDSTLVFPAHDYHGRRRSTVLFEKSTNPRLTKEKAEFVTIMENLGLSPPKRLDVSVPANMKCGVY